MVTRYSPIPASISYFKWNISSSSKHFLREAVHPLPGSLIFLSWKFTALATFHHSSWHAYNPTCVYVAVGLMSISSTGLSGMIITQHHCRHDVCCWPLCPRCLEQGQQAQVRRQDIVGEWMNEWSEWANEWRRHYHCHFTGVSKPSPVLQEMCLKSPYSLRLHTSGFMSSQRVDQLSCLTQCPEDSWLGGASDSDCDGWS